MQIKKQEVQQAIVAAARAEFREHGFSGANLRRIAGAAGCSLSNLYNYFAGKDELFIAVVNDRLVEIRGALDWIRTFRMPKDVCMQTEDEERYYYRIISNYIREHRADLELIFLKSSGSSVAVLEDEDDRPECSDDGQQVAEARLDGHRERPEAQFRFVLDDQNLLARHDAPELAVSLQQNYRLKL